MREKSFLIMEGKHKKKAQCNRAVSESTYVSELTAELNEHAFQGRIFDARDIALKLQSLKKVVSDASARTDIDSVEHIIEEVIEQADHVYNLLHELHSDDGWTLAKEGKGVTIHYRREEGTNIHTVRAQTVFRNFQPNDFSRLCSLFVETESMPLWFPAGVMKKASVLSWHSKYSKVVQLHIGLDMLPFLSPRDAIVFGNGYHLPDRNAFLIRSKSTLDDTCRFCDIPKPATGVVRMTTESIFFVQLLQKDVISFKMIGRDDLKLKYVPSPLLNYIAQGHLPYELMRSVKRTIRNFEGSVWDMKMKERGSYYKEIQDKVHVQLEKWDNEGSHEAFDQNFNHGHGYNAKVPKKPNLFTNPSPRNDLNAVIIVAVISTPLLLLVHHSIFDETFSVQMATSKFAMLLESEHFQHIISATPTLLMSLASIRKIIKLLSNASVS